MRERTINRKIAFFIGRVSAKERDEGQQNPLALTTFLSANPQIKTIVLHLDNDKVGRLCTATLKELLQKDYKIVDDPPPVGKDFNDFLLSYLKIARPKLKRERSDVRDCVAVFAQKDTETKSKFNAESEE